MTVLTRTGIRLPSAPSAEDDGALAQLVETARAAEAAGVDSLWVEDRPQEVVRPGGPGALEAYTLLGALAAVTTTARLGALVSAAGDRPPSLLAKQVTALDVLSGGRAVLGLGLGPGPGEASGPEGVERLEEALAVCRAMFSEDEATVSGRHYSVEGAANRPRPVQRGGPPVLVSDGGDSRLLDIAARGADAVHLAPGSSRVPQSPVADMRERRRASGRDPDSLTVITTVEAPGVWESSDPTPLVDEARRLVDAGYDGMILDVPAGARPEAVARLSAALAEEISRGR